MPTTKYAGSITLHVVFCLNGTKLFVLVDETINSWKYSFLPKPSGVCWRKLQKKKHRFLQLHPESCHTSTKFHDCPSQLISTTRLLQHYLISLDIIILPLFTSLDVLILFR
ncbi:hypothetical protein XENOCAPTIV_010865 [Xenoophorus captivus]|uniref:Uncharacterized protein n=1 Tax=Xenoophorus captivus TaxID=1517983 RepID=A0ABV0QAB7_9TELE